MKLVELLARELDVWPEGCEVVVQEHEGRIHGCSTESVEYEVGIWSSDDWWAMTGNEDYSSCGKYGSVLDVSDDHATAIITRADWQAERERIAGGWIAHDGRECPVDKGVRVDVRYRDGGESMNQPALERGLPLEAWAEDWSHDGRHADIMAYRICEPVQDTYTMDWQERDPMQALTAPEPETLTVDELQAAIGHPDGPLQWRDRIHTIDFDIAAQNEAHRLAIETLEEERVSLVQLLAEEGLQLVGASAVQVDDMSDSKNWKAGDIIQCLDSFSGQFTEGSLYRVRGEVSGSRVSVEVDDDNQENGWHADHFKFHSRPTA